MKKLSSLLVVLLSLNHVVSAATDPDKNGGKTKKHVEHEDLNFAHHVPLTTFYSTTNDGMMLAFSLITDSTDNILVYEVPEKKRPKKLKKRLIVNVYLFDENKKCPKADSIGAVELSEWLGAYAPKAKLKQFNLAEGNQPSIYTLYSFTASFKEKDGNDDAGQPNRRGAQFIISSCTENKTLNNEIQPFRHDGSTIAHPKG